MLQLMHEDTTLPKLFTAAFESVFRRLTWETRGLKIDDEYLSQLHFADDIHKLADESDNLSLKMNKSKTKVIMETDTPIYVNNTQIENAR